MTPGALAERALRLLRIASPIGHEAAIADAVEAWAKQHVPAQEVLRVGHSLVVGRLDDSRPSVALVGHLDTVAPHSVANPPRVEGDRLYGLGASDMKGALAVMQALVETVPRDTLPVNPLFVFYEKEEGPFEESGLGPLFDAAPQLGRLAFAVALEPTDGAVQVGCVGSLHATVTFQGKSTHAARPWHGQNAVHAAGTLLAELDGRGRREVEVGGFTYAEVMSATVAHGGRARNVVPDRFELNVNVRFAPGKTNAQALEELNALVAGRAQVTLVDVAPSAKVCADSPYFERLVAATGRPAEPKQAWTDVARFSQLGVDAVNYGPGETAQAHQQGESASVAALGTAFQVLDAFLRAPLAPT